MRGFLLGALLAATASSTQGSEVVWYDGQQAVSYQVQGKAAPVVEIALQMFSSDMAQVTGRKAVSRKDATILIYQLDKNISSISKLQRQGVPVGEVQGRHDAFWIGTHDGHILVVGANGRGCAYGLLELSRQAGVSPWIWWGDVVPERRTRLVFSETSTTLQAPSVAYRGIFINDEDWSLRNWAWKNYEKTAAGPGQFGVIGPKTYKAIFQLLLRLRANALWPAMHEGTAGFFTIPGNKAMADSCGILIGSSHCEPLLRNNVAEWDRSVRGDYNYITNREQVKHYWAERLKEVKGAEELFTIGMRGIHDGSMEGVKTKEEKLQGLQQVIDDQRELIRACYNEHVENVPQVFIPYKEVLEIMESGLRVPDDVTLMWCDDNYGYMTRLSDGEQQKRSGGGGVYYHLSYWGRPHDYLWLTTTQPGLIYSEMLAAYDHNCRKLWIANVHDPKVAAYDLQLFLDMAWDINGLTANSAPAGEAGSRAVSLTQHLERWLCAQFGEEAGKRLFPVMHEFYRLCCIRKPEFMGWTQVELSDRKAYPRGRSQVVDTEFTSEFGNELNRYLASYNAITSQLGEIKQTLRPELHDAFFAAIEYPVCSASAMARKMLYAQKARSRYQGQADKSTEGREAYLYATAGASMRAYRLIQHFTDKYNNEMAGGKWKGLMNMMPRDLNVFNPPILPYLPTDEEVGNAEDSSLAAPEYDDDFPRTDVVARNACDYTASSGCPSPEVIQMLGHSMSAVAIPKGCELDYEFESPAEGEAMLYTAMIPTQPNDRGDLRYSVQMDDREPVVISLKEKYRSDFWKLSVLRGQALKQTPVRVSKGRHTLKVKALDDHIICDQWMLDFKQGRKFYVIPAI